MNPIAWLRRKGNTRPAIPELLATSPSGAEIWKVYASSKLFNARSDDEHLKATMDWLIESLAACGGKGSSASYSVVSGWAGAYPETSGYIIGTFLAYYDLTGQKSYLEKAVELGDWEIEIQTTSGAVLSSLTNDIVRVFNTGQVVLGWCLLYERTADSKYLEAAIRAADFLVTTQEPDGRWQKNTYCGARTYHSRIDWALIRVANLSNDAKYEATAVRNLEWIKSCARGNGWFSSCGFDQSDPITHVIDYTLRGLLECHVLRPSLNLLPMVEKSVDNLVAAMRRSSVKKNIGMIPQSFDSSWKGNSASSCLTGNAQLAYLFNRLVWVGSSACYPSMSDQLIDAIKGTQVLDCEDKSIRGAVPGCFPFYSGYCQYAYPNWAAKFFADALMMKKGFRGKFHVDA